MPPRQHRQAPGVSLPGSFPDREPAQPEALQAGTGPVTESESASDQPLLTLQRPCVAISGSLASPGAAPGAECGSGSCTALKVPYTRRRHCVVALDVDSKKSHATADVTTCAWAGACKLAPGRSRHLPRRLLPVPMFEFVILPCCL